MITTGRRVLHYRKASTDGELRDKSTNLTSIPFSGDLWGLPSDERASEIDLSGHGAEDHKVYSDNTSRRLENRQWRDRKAHQEMCSPSHLKTATIILGIHCRQ
jgi:hypothetical protein